MQLWLDYGANQTIHFDAMAVTSSLVEKCLTIKVIIDLSDRLFSFASVLLHENGSCFDLLHSLQNFVARFSFSEFLW